MLSIPTDTAAQRGFSVCFMAEFSSSCGDFGSSCCHHYHNTPWGLTPGDSGGGGRKAGAGGSQVPACVVCLLQLTVVERSPEFTIRELFWLTEYCLSVEPSMANRRVPTTRSDEQCVTTGHGDSKWDPGERECRPPEPLLALGVWGSTPGH